MLFVVSMLYAALVFISITFLSDMPLIVLAGLLYVLPLIVSVVVTNKLIKQSKNTGIAKLIMVPLLSLLFYISFGIFAEQSGGWQQYILQNTVQTSKFTVEVSNSLLYPSQLIFATILYFSIFGLSKRFSGNDFYSLKDVNLTINQGDIVGLIGKNGAGKSTLLKLIAKSLRPTDGSIEYFGHNIHQTKHILSNFGIMIEPVFYPEMTVMDNLKFYLDIHGKKEQYSNIEKTLRLVDLWEARNRKPKGFSFGMKQRTALAIALVSEPEFLLLDEPFVGLDPLGVNQLISILKQWSQERNISMIISSHQLGELEALCNRYVYIEGGRLETEMQIQSAPSVIIQLKDDLSEVQLPLELFESIQDGKIEVTIDSEADYLNQLMYTLSSQKAIKKIEIKENHLKDYFEMGD